MSTTAGYMNEVRNILLAVRASGKSRKQQAKELTALLNSAGIVCSEASAFNSLTVMGYDGDDRLLRSRMHDSYRSPIGRIKQEAAARYLRAQTDASKVELADLVAAYQQHAAALAKRKAEREAAQVAQQGAQQGAAPAATTTPPAPAQPIQWPGAKAPSIDQIAECNVGELYTLARIINVTTRFTSESSVRSALRGIKTRNTKKYKGNTDYFDEVRQVGVDLCKSRAAGKPWPELKTIAVTMPVHAGGPRSRTHGELLALTEEVRTLRERNAALEQHYNLAEKQVDQLREQLAEQERNIQPVVNATDTDRLALMAERDSLRTQCLELKHRIAIAQMALKGAEA